MNEPVSLRPWIRITAIGWLLGIALVIALALIGEIVGVRGSQISVGLGMGLGVGLAQERALRPLLGRAHTWRWATTFGMALPFVVVDLARVIAQPIPYSLYFSIAAAGLTTGALQARVLKSHRVSAILWVLASTLGWTTAALIAGLADSLTRWSTIRGLPGALLYLALVASGGPLLGLTTSRPLRPIAARRP